jgi:hypothetical protein
MGDDLVAALQARGYTVDRLGLQGRNDAQLLDQSDQLDDLSRYDRVFLYAGGNSDLPSVPDLRALIDHFGASRTVVILPPVNVDRPPAKVAAQRAKNAANAAGIIDLVPVYGIELPGSNFKSDSIHLRPGTPAGRDYVAGILATTLDGASGSWVGWAVGGLALGLGAAWLSRRTRKRG